MSAGLPHWDGNAPSTLQQPVGHLCAEMLNSFAKIKLTGVHYKGSGPSMIDLVAGHVQTQFPSMPAAVQYVRTGRLRMIAQTGATRSGAAPNVPTMEEAGLKDFELVLHTGILGPPGMPRPVVDRLNAEFAKAVS